MQESSLTRFGPLVILLVLLSALALRFVPGMYRSHLLRGTCNAMLEQAASGSLTAAQAWVVQEQHGLASGLFGNIPPGYEQELDSLKLTTMERSGNEGWCIVTCRLKTGAAGLAIYQAKLRWVWIGGKWQWDLKRSQGAQFSPSGEPDWIPLENLLPLAGLANAL